MKTDTGTSLVCPGNWKEVGTAESERQETGRLEEMVKELQRLFGEGGCLGARGRGQTSITTFRDSCPNQFPWSCRAG